MRHVMLSDKRERPAKAFSQKAAFSLPKSINALGGPGGGARRNRTDDLFNAIEALSQLSYGPKLSNLAVAPHA